MICKDLVCLIKEFLTLNEIATLSPISKMWRDTISYSPSLVMINPTNDTLNKAINHINKSTIKHIFINQRNSDIKYTLSKKIINNFMTIISNAGAKLSSINFYKLTRNYSNPNIYFPFTNNSFQINYGTNFDYNDNNELLKDRPITYEDTKNIILSGYKCYYNKKIILSIRGLSFRHTNNESQIQFLNELIKSLTLSKLKYLDYFGHQNDMRRNDIECLRNIKKTNLKCLKIRSCDALTCDAIKSINEGLQNTHLEYFSINFCFRLMDNDVEQLVSILKHSKLKFFDISHNYNITNISLDPEKMSKTLCYLNIACCNVTNAIFKLLLEGLSETRIISINLSNSLRDDMIPCLIEKLKSTNIHHINLSESILTDFSVCSLIEALKNNNINSFDLSATQIELRDMNMPLILKIINNKY